MQLDWDYPTTSMNYLENLNLSKTVIILVAGGDLY
jgi:hypothetical protein